MADRHTEIGLGLKMDGSTHFNDLTNLATSPRHAMGNDHQAASSGQQLSHGFAQHNNMGMTQGAAYDTSSHDTLMKHSAPDLSVYNGPHVEGNSMHQQHTGATNQAHDADSQPSAPHSAGLEQAFADMGSHTNSAQRQDQATQAHSAPDMQGMFDAQIQSSGSQTTIQGHTLAEESAHPTQGGQIQPHPVSFQVKSELSPSVDRHQVRSYPPSPPTRSQMFNPDPRSFPLGMRPMDGRHVPSHRPSHSLGQAAAFMSGVPDRTIFAHNHTSAPVSPSDGMHSGGPFDALFQYSDPRHDAGINMAEHVHVLEHGGPHLAARNHGHFTRSCAPSVRSTSPSASMASTSMTSISPLGSARMNADGSFTSQETSFDSLSNAASGSYSRASSTSDELFYSDLGGSLGLPSSLRMSKQKKKLRNIDRKMICDYSVAHPTVKQDAIANEFGIERSTVSKILKQKDKWLSIDPESGAARIAKHRAVKFPAVEDRLTSWVDELKARGEPIRDSTLRQEALRIARELGLGEDKFKASGGWIEKFRERNQIPKPRNAESGSTGPDAPESAKSPTPSPSHGAGAFAPRTVASTPSSDAVGPSSGAEGQTNPAGRQSTRNSKAKGTPGKRAREVEEKTQAILGMSPLSHDMARMHFNNGGAPAQMPNHPGFFRPNFYEGHPAGPQPMQNYQLMVRPDGMPGPSFLIEDQDQQERKRMRAMQAFQGHQAAMGLGPAIDFHFPQAIGPAASPSQQQQQMTMLHQLPQGPSDQTPDLSPRARRTPSKATADGSTRGRSRRGNGRLSNANHTPQTPSPLSVSPADAIGEIIFHGLDRADAQQLTAAAMERIRALQNSSDKSSVVTAQQAQQSLDLVLRFLSEQPSDFLPANHLIIFGHLQANIEQKIRGHQEQPGDGPVAEASGSGSQAPVQADSSSNGEDNQMSTEEQLNS
ncbi:uncharacterized protein UHOD_00631 [Ustilago sp. UG-2017b]|nr:uncharacterized protein UHOD_00631 [Ustilago sp. UG-2017b]